MSNTYSCSPIGLKLEEAVTNAQMNEYKNIYTDRRICLITNLLIMHSRLWIIIIISLVPKIF